MMNIFQSEKSVRICFLILFAISVIWLSVQGVEYITIVIAGIAAFVIFIYPIIGLLAIVFLIPVETMSVFYPSMTVLKLLGLWTFLCFLIKHFRLKKPIKIDKVYWLFLIFLGWALFSLLWAGNISVALICLLTLAQLIGLYILFINLINSKRKMNWIIAVFIIGTIIFSIFALREFLIEGTIYYKNRMVLKGNNPNNFGAAVGIAMFATWYFIVSKSGKWWQQLILILILIYLLFIFIFAQSRAAWIGFIVSSIGYFLFRKRVEPRRILRAILLCTIFSVTIFLIIFFSSERKYILEERLLSIFHPLEIDSFTARVYIWEDGYEMWKKNPLMGVGLHNFHVKFHEFSELNVEIDSHSTYITIICELGLIGILIWAIIMLSLFKTIVNNPEYGVLTLTLFVLFLVLSISGTYYHSKLQWLVFGIIGVSANLKLRG